MYINIKILWDDTANYVFVAKEIIFVSIYKELHQLNLVKGMIYVNTSGYKQRSKKRRIFYPSVSDILLSMRINYIHTFNHVNHAMMQIFMCIYLTVKFDGKQNGLLPELCIKMVQFGAGIGNITYCIYIYISEALMDHYFIWIHICCI